MRLDLSAEPLLDDIGDLQLAGRANAGSHPLRWHPGNEPRLWHPCDAGGGHSCARGRRRRSGDRLGQQESGGQMDVVLAKGATDIIRIG